MKVFVTGGTGFVGSHLVPALLEAGHEVRVLARNGSERKLPKALREKPGLSFWEGDATRPETLEGAAQGCEAVIHLIGIIEDDADLGISYEKMHIDATRNVVEAARAAGAKRFLFMSALGTRDQAESEYHRTKWRAEHLVRSSAIPFTIFRPSLIFGKGDGFVNLQKQFINGYSPLVVPGDGKTLFQPVAIEDVVAGFVQALDNPKAVGQVYEVGGPDRLTLNEIIERIAKAKGVAPGIKFPPAILMKPLAHLMHYLWEGFELDHGQWVIVRALHPPVWLMKPVAGIMHRIWGGFPVNKEQVVMLQEDSVCEAKKFFGDFGLSAPKRFTVEALRQYV